MNIDTILDFSRNYAIESDETNIPEANINDVKNFDLAPIAAVYFSFQHFIKKNIHQNTISLTHF